MADRIQHQQHQDITRANMAQSARDCKRRITRRLKSLPRINQRKKTDDWSKSQLIEGIPHGDARDALIDLGRKPRADEKTLSGSPWI